MFLLCVYLYIQCDCVQQISSYLLHALIFTLLVKCRFINGIIHQFVDEPRKIIIFTLKINKLIYDLHTLLNITIHL